MAGIVAKRQAIAGLLQVGKTPAAIATELSCSRFLVYKVKRVIFWLENQNFKSFFKYFSELIYMLKFFVKNKFNLNLNWKNYGYFNIALAECKRINESPGMLPSVSQKQFQ